MSTAEFLRVACLALPLAAGIPGVTHAAPTPSDRELLERIEKDSIHYFVRMSDKVTGLTRDSSRTGSPASVAATGFSLAAIAIGQSRGWIERPHAYRQIEKTLKTLLRRAEHERGFFYHFLDMRTGKRVWASEASSIDTALLIAGALLAGQYFPGTPIEKMAHALYRRVDWKWMMNGSDLVSMGWKPETGFLPYYWDTYNEHLILQALAIGAPSQPIPPRSWHAWERRQGSFHGKEIVYAHSGSLFTYQYPQAFIDFRDLNDGGVNYFENSRLAAVANWEYSGSFSHLYEGYQSPLWGLSACLGPGGYQAYGGKPGEGRHDGTIAPYAALGSIAFTPEESTAAARFYFTQFYESLYGDFGFRDGFNLSKKWWAGEYLGVDQGITVLMLENYLNEGAVWKRFMALEAVERWVSLAQLTPKGAAPTLSA